MVIILIVKMLIFFQESGGYLERVLFFLKYEPKVLPEGIIYDQAVENLKDLQKLYQTMGITSPTT